MTKAACKKTMENIETQFNFVLVNFVRQLIGLPEIPKKKLRLIRGRNHSFKLLNSKRERLEVDISELMAEQESQSAVGKAPSSELKSRVHRIDKQFTELLNLGVAPDKLIDMNSLLRRRNTLSSKLLNQIDSMLLSQ